MVILGKKLPLTEYGAGGARYALSLDLGGTHLLVFSVLLSQDLYVVSALFHIFYNNTKKKF